MDSLFSHLAHILVLPLVLGAFAWLFPYQKVAVLRPLTPLEMETLQPQLNKSGGWFLLFFLTITPLMVWLIYDFLLSLDHVLPKPADNFVYSFQLDETFWLLPAICIGFGASLPVILKLVRKIFGNDRYILLNHAYSQQYGFDNEGILKWMTRIFVGMGVVFTLLCYNLYAGIQGKEVVINKGLELRERRYAFAEITKLTYVDYQIVRQQETEAYPYYEIAFRDGFVWDTREFLRNVPIEKDRPIVEYLSQQTRLSIDSTELIKQPNQ